jgi:hypothetical protein
MKRTSILYLLIVTAASLSIFWLLQLGATLPPPGGTVTTAALTAPATNPASNASVLLAFTR